MQALSESAQTHAPHCGSLTNLGGDRNMRRRVREKDLSVHVDGTLTQMSSAWRYAV